MDYVYAGDRQISCDILNFLIDRGFIPKALLVSNGLSASHADQLISISGLPASLVMKGIEFKNEDNVKKLRELGVDYIFGIHFPYIIPADVLKIPQLGFINLHPAYLPYNKGWHTPSWAILDGTPYGATLHFMSEELDEGDIIHKKQMEIDLADTANTLYQKVLQLEYDVFVEAFNDLKALKPKRLKQLEKGTSHVKKDLSKIQQLNLQDATTVGEVLNHLRALTTNNKAELSYFIDKGKKVGVSVQFIELE